MTGTFEQNPLERLLGDFGDPWTIAMITQGDLPFFLEPFIRDVNRVFGVNLDLKKKHLYYFYIDEEEEPDVLHVQELSRDGQEVVKRWALKCPPPPSRRI